jgi:hypothetical protein
MHPRRHCIGAAVSDKPMGPYTPLSSPLVCDIEEGGAIDPQYFHDPLTDESFLLYKVDGNAIGTGGACGNTNMPNTPTPIRAAPLNPSDPTEILSNSTFEVVTNQPWDGAYLENPVMWYQALDERDLDGHPGVYHLLFNAGCFTDPSYRIDRVSCLADPALGMRGCDWNALRTRHGDDQAIGGTLLKSGETIAELRSPGGPTVALIGSKGKVNPSWLGFHADAHLEWFDSGEPLVGGSRRRAFFMADLIASSPAEGLTLGSLVRPKCRCTMWGLIAGTFRSACDTENVSRFGDCLISPPSVR